MIITDNLIYKDSIINGKIHDSLEDPISASLYDISDNISKPLYSYGINANIITIFRISLIIFAFLYCFENKMYKTASGLYLLAFFGDCLDGHLSRQMNSNNNVHDYYDCFADIITLSLSIYFIAKSLSEYYRWILSIILLLLVLSLFHTSCEERYMVMTGLKNKYTLPIKCLCSNNVVDNEDLEDTMEISRLFGFGTYHVFIAILLWNFSGLAN
jgi:phosphatidylglycerophosphate synthase